MQHEGVRESQTMTLQTSDPRRTGSEGHAHPSDGCEDIREKTFPRHFLNLFCKPLVRKGTTVKSSLHVSLNIHARRKSQDPFQLTYRRLNKDKK